MKDLVVLAADKDLEYALHGLFSRPQALNIRPISYDIFVESDHDPACFTRGVEFLSTFSTNYTRALLMFDHEGCGGEQESSDAIQQGLDARFSKGPWGDRARAILLAPELEIWVWSDSPHLDEVAGWRDREPSLRMWLQREGYVSEGQLKPARPKEAFERALRLGNRARSASLYRQLAGRVSIQRCADPSLLRLLNFLREWFPSSGF